MEKLKKGDVWHRFAGVTIIYDPDGDPYGSNEKIKKHYKERENDRNNHTGNIDKRKS